MLVSVVVVPVVPVVAVDETATAAAAQRHVRLVCERRRDALVRRRRRLDRLVHAHIDRTEHPRALTFRCCC